MWACGVATLPGFAVPIAPDRIPELFALHLGAVSLLRDRLRGEAHRRGMSVVELDLTGVSDNVALGRCLPEAFMFPQEASGLDAAVDLISDLEWLGILTATWFSSVGWPSRRRSQTRSCHCSPILWIVDVARTCHS